MADQPIEDDVDLTDKSDDADVERVESEKPVDAEKSLSEFRFRSASVTQQPQPQPQPSPTECRNWHFTVAFAGPSRVGKTKLIHRFTDSQFSDGYTETMEASQRSKAVNIGRHHVTFQCWDTPGQGTLDRGLDRRLRFLHALFIVFDASRQCADELQRWSDLANKCGPPRPMLVLVGNKTDLGQHPDSLTTARQLSASASALIFSLSVLADDENVEVDAMMLEVAKELTERHSRPLLMSTAAASALKARPGPAGERPGAADDGASGSCDSSEEAEAGGDRRRKSSTVGAKLKEALTSWFRGCPSCC